MPQAASLAEKLKQSFDVDAELIRASGGVFEVMVDDKLVYSKKATGTFPDEDQLIASLRT